MKFRLMLGILAAVVLAAGAAGAAVQSGAEFLDIVQQRVDRGDITADEALLLKFQYCFDQEQLPADLQPVGVAPLKCGTSIVMEFYQRRAELDPALALQLGNYLEIPQSAVTDIYTSPSGKFRCTYQRTGTDAVPLADTDGSGVPDYVENCASYLEYSFDTECTELGFKSPPFSASYPYMNIYFSALEGIYGFTQPVTNPPGMTRITLDNDFIGFPPNDDPDGDSLGAAKVTAAHEFKHSTQYAGSRWSEGGWVELDATWAEDIVYPATNDYFNYLSFGSPISDPDVSLDGGSSGTGSYEDCVWQHYLSQTHGDQMIVDLFDYRIQHQAEAMMDSYEYWIDQYGSTLVESWNEFTMWNFATGARYLSGQGYAEGYDYPTGSEQRLILTYPYTYNAVVPRIAANFVRCRNVAAAGQALRVNFNGANGVDMTLAAVVNVNYAAQTGAMYLIPLDENNDAVYDVPFDLDGVYSVGVVIGNAEKTGGFQSYSLTVSLVPFNPLAVGDDVPTFAITGNYPNPFNPTTAIKFGVDVGGPAQLDIYDIAGRKVRTLLDANIGSGEHRVMWNGQDDAGRGLASGTYVAQLRVGDQVTSHKLVLAK